MSPQVCPAAIAAMLVLAGCGSSPPTRFYTLAAAPAEASSPVAVPGTPIRVAAVTVPAELDRPQIVRREDATRLDIATLDRWAAPLEDQIRRVLSEDLSARLPGGVIAPTAPSVPAGTRSVTLDIDRFDADRSGHVVLAGEWALVVDNRALMRQAETIELDAAGTEAADAPAAMSRALGRLADRIAARLAAATNR
jgi:uncharacterized lipoprotein YmbA